jgi:hypothetical protein
MGTVCFSKTLALTYETTNRQNPKHQNHGKPLHSTRLQKKNQRRKKGLKKENVTTQI